MGGSIDLAQDGTILRDGCRLSYKPWRWMPDDAAVAGRAATAREALAGIAARASLRHLVVGVIGPREATDEQRGAAEALGRGLGALGLTTICGGKSGVMEAVCRGVDAAGGLAIGILPGTHPDEANAFVGIALPTGLNEARNMVIARAARVLIAVGGSYGTLTEIAYGLHFSKAVIVLEDAPEIAGVTPAGDVDEAIELAARALIASATPAEAAR